MPTKPEADAVEKIQQKVKEKYRGKYPVLARKLGAGWYRQRIARVLDSSNPKTLELLAVCSAAGVLITPILQQLHL